MIEHSEQVTYKILYGNINSLEESVNEHLKNGWELQGGLASKGHEFIQAVVRIEKITNAIETEVTVSTFADNWGSINDKTLISSTILALKKFINEGYPLERAIEIGATTLNYASTQDIKELIIKGAPANYLEARAFLHSRQRDINDPMYKPNKI